MLQDAMRQPLNAIVHVYGVVTFFKPLYKTRGTGRFTVSPLLPLPPSLPPSLPASLPLIHPRSLSSSLPLLRPLSCLS